MPSLDTVNLILFDHAETTSPLPRSDHRARHLLEVLRREPGDEFDAGLVNGLRGRGTLVAVGADALTLRFDWTPGPPPPPDPITLIVGLPRPQTARDILRDATTLGVAAIHFVTTEKSERNYAGSALWTSGEWRRQMIAGAAQAFDTHIPEVTWQHPLAEVLEDGIENRARFALDNYEAGAALGTFDLKRDQSICLAIGPERGWGSTDRDLLRARGFTLAHLGPRPLRTETAVVAALTVVKTVRGQM
jgi:16S rRNA (uracil1498-N3)-methyltransferase